MFAGQGGDAASGEWQKVQAPIGRCGMMGAFSTFCV